MSQELPQRLLQVICADPGDDDARLVYADWLAEHGDAARAEFIRLQLSRAKLPAWDPERVRLELRERALLAEHGERWRQELPELKGVAWGGFERGFVHRAAFASVAALQEHAALCQGATPLASVAVRWTNKDDWSGLGAMSGLRELTMFGTLYRDSDIEGLARSPLLSTLRALNLVECGLNGEALRLLLASPYLENLAALRLPHHQLDGVDALVEARSLPSLQELDLSVATADELGSGGRDEEPIDADAVTVLASWSGLAKLRSLDLSGNPIGSRGLQALLCSPHAVGLKALHLREITARRPLSMLAFRKAHPGLSLETLSLKGPLEVGGAARLAGAPCLSELKVLHLQVTNLGDDEAYARLAQAPWFDSLRVLDAPYGNGGGLLKAVLARGPARLHTLNLEGSLTWSRFPGALAALAASPATDGLLQLDLSHNRITDAEIDVLGQARGLQGLQFLGLRERRDVPEPVAERLLKSPLGQRLVGLELGSRGQPYDRLPRPRKERLAYGAYRGPLLFL